MDRPIWMYLWRGAGDAWRVLIAQADLRDKRVAIANRHFHHRAGGVWSAVPTLPLQRCMLSHSSPGNENERRGRCLEIICAGVHNMHSGRGKTAVYVYLVQIIGLQTGSWRLFIIHWLSFPWARSPLIFALRADVYRSEQVRETALVCASVRVGWN